MSFVPQDSPTVASFNRSELLVPPSVIDCTVVPTGIPGVLAIKEDGSEAESGDDLFVLQRETVDQQRAIFPIGSSGLIGVWPRPGGQVPTTVWPIMCGVLPVTDQEEIVEFNGHTEKLGVNMLDILEGRFGGLKKAEDLVLRKFQGKDATLVITWLGYEKQECTIYTQFQTGAPITRLNLAAQITTAYAELFKKVENERVLPAKVGFYNIALHQGKKRRVDSLGIQFAQLYLVKCYNTTAGYFVAEVDIL